MLYITYIKAINDDNIFVTIINMEQKLIKTLKNLGLTEKESKVYLACLSAGKSTVTRIANTSEIKRTTVYPVIESLKSKGLISIEVVGWKKYYVAEPPQKLEFLLEEKRKNLLDNLSGFEAIQNTAGDKGFIRYYEGLEASKTIYEEMLQDLGKDDFYYAIAGGEKWLNLDFKYFSNFIKRRAKIDCGAKVIANDSKEVRRYQKNQKIYNQETKVFSNDNFVSTNLFIIPTKVVLHHLNPPITTIVIENKSIINLQKMLFEIIWESIN